MTVRPEALADFLRLALACGALSVPEIEAMARTAGLLRGDQQITHSKLFKRVKKSLGIRSVRSGFGASGEWVWLLDERPAPPNMESASQALVESAPVAADVHSEAKMESSAEDDLAGAASSSRVPLGWIEGVAALDYYCPPTDIPPQRWRRFVDDCNNFLTPPKNWAERAAQLGWDAVALFGCNRRRPLEHLGSAGLLWIVNGGRLGQLHRDWAVIELALNGSQRVFHRRRLDAANITLPWIGLRRHSTG